NAPPAVRNHRARIEPGRTLRSEAPLFFADGKSSSILPPPARLHRRGPPESAGTGLEIFPPAMVLHRQDKRPVDPDLLHSHAAQSCISDITTATNSCRPA